MKVYLAAAWSRRAEIEQIAARLKAKGVEITSNWLYEETRPPEVAHRSWMRERAHIDLGDVDRADAIVRFTDPETQTADPEADVDRRLLSAARMVEFGYAKAKGKALIVVGGHQNVFDFMTGVVHLPDADALVKYLSQEESGTGYV